MPTPLPYSTHLDRSPGKGRVSSACSARRPGAVTPWKVARSRRFVKSHIADVAVVVAGVDDESAWFEPVFLA
jgi:hypothetical protein